MPCTGRVEKWGNMSSNTLLSLFSGAGGLDIGLEQAGFRTLGQVEMDDDSVGTLRLHAEAKAQPPRIYHCRLEDLDPREVRKELGLERGDLTLLAGGPPCQPFTTAGLRKAINDRRASSAISTMLEFLGEFEPSAVLVENVDGILSAALDHRPLKDRGGDNPPLEWEETKGSFLHWFLTELGGRGYSVSWGVLEAADHGVPQMRQRAFMIGIRGDRPCYLPQPSYGQPGLPPYRTLADALADIEEIGPVQPLSDRKTEVFAEIPPGGNWRNLTEERQRETMGAAYHATGGKSGWWRRLDWSSPSPTILGMPDHSSTALIHPDEVRCLSVTTLVTDRSTRNASPSVCAAGAAWRTSSSRAAIAAPSLAVVSRARWTVPTLHSFMIASCICG